MTSNKQAAIAKYYTTIIMSLIEAMSANTIPTQLGS
jgi:hypothetical protein